MEKLLNYCLKFIPVLFFLSLASCQQDNQYYKKEFTEAEHLENAERLLSGLGYRYYYQGSTGELELLKEAALHNEDHPEVWRERGIPYLKRGIAAGYYKPYERCAELDPEHWLGNKAYCTLYFYRDYESALTDIDQLDPLTPDFVDHPQATSIDYMRAICYLGMEEPEKALSFVDKHIEVEKESVGMDYVNPVALILKSKAHKSLGQLDEAEAVLEKGLKSHEKNADIKFYLAQLLFEKGEKKRAKALAEKAKIRFKETYFNSRPYVEEFYQIYLADIEELLEQLS